METEHRGGTLVFRTGPGEQYNQPERGRWDMGEDVQPLPSAPWHLALDEAVRKADSTIHTVIVDATEMWDLVGHDWRYLMTLAKRLHGESRALLLVADERTRRAVELLGLGELVQTSPSVDAALGIDPRAGPPPS